MAHNTLTPFGGDQMRDMPFPSLRRDMSRWLDDVFRSSGMVVPGGEGPSGGMLMPHMNVSENDKEIRITAELPGVAEKDVDVTLDDDVLTIRGEKKHEERGDKENYHFAERSFGSFQRSLRIPRSVKTDRVKAEVKDGVLTVTLPKSAEQEKARHIHVQGGNK